MERRLTSRLCGFAPRPVCVRDSILDRDHHISIVDSIAAMPLLIVPVKRNGGSDELRENASATDLDCIRPRG